MQAYIISWDTGFNRINQVCTLAAYKKHQADPSLAGFLTEHGYRSVQDAIAASVIRSRYGDRFANPDLS